MSTVQRVVAAPLIGLIVLYQRFISPMRPPTCRYYPSCSAYALTAIRRFGPGRGTWLALKRLARCHPWTPGGVDHVPPRAKASPPPAAPAPRDSTTKAPPATAAR
jgi:putative membrane protein insertion efficiency factor